MILSAVYALSLYRRTVFGEMTNPALAQITKVNTVMSSLQSMLLGVAVSLFFRRLGNLQRAGGDDAPL